MVVFDLEWVLLKDSDDFSNGKFLLMFLEDSFEGVFFGDSFEGDEVVEVFGDVRHFLEGDSLDPLFFTGGNRIFNDFEDKLLPGLIFLLIVFLEFVEFGLKQLDILCFFSLNEIILIL